MQSKTWFSFSVVLQDFRTEIPGERRSLEKIEIIFSF